MVVFKLIALISLLVVTVTAVRSPSVEKALLDRILQNYDGNIRPDGANGTGPTQVSVNMFVRSIRGMDDLDMAMKTQLTFRMQWLDERLRFDGEKGDDVRSVRYLSVSSTLGDKLWKPDLFFSNELEYQRHDGLVPNVYYRIFPNGEILFSQRISLKLSCPMILKNYPFDSQTCSLRMASYGYTTEDIIFKWKPLDPVQVTLSLHLPKFAMKQFTTDYCDSMTNTGTYSCLRVDLLFHREASAAIAKYFVPMIIGILIIWCSMWISPVDYAVVRTLILGAGAFYCKWSSSPAFHVSYTTALDSWCSWINLLILVALIEFVIVLRFTPGNKQDNAGNNRWTRLGTWIEIVLRIIYPLTLLGVILLFYISYASDEDDNE